MSKKSFSEGFKTTYAMSLVGQLGFYIAIPFIIVIAGHNYLDKLFLDEYLIPNYRTIHLILDFMLAFAVGAFSFWQIYKIILPFMDKK
ncbi:MAG: hypothetical protein Q8N37_03710 [bacterium]|nr:hypothetical protein [bacterium]